MKAIGFSGITKTILVAWACLGILIHAGDTRLAGAFEANRAEQIVAALTTGADLNASQVDGMTALHWACYHDETELAERLINLGATVNARNRYGISPLYLACLNGNESIVKRLLSEGVDPNTAINGGEMALMTAARTGNMDTVRALIKAGADLDATERKGQTAIMWASHEGHAAVVKLLLESGADYETPLESGYTPFLFAVREGHRDIVHSFLDAGVDINLVTDPKRTGKKSPAAGTSPLLLAVENGHYDLAVELLERGANPDDMSTGATVLHALSWIRKPDKGESASGDPAPRGSGRRNSDQFIRELIAKYGANPNLRLEKGKNTLIGASPFYLAADRADLPFMKLLVELGGDPHITTRNGTTALMASAGVGSFAPEEEAGNEEECLAAVKYCVSLGLDPNAIDSKGQTAMHGAALKNIPSMVHYLNEIGSDIGIWNQKDSNGWTPLLIAEGYRPGNFKPSFVTVDAITEVMLSRGVEPPRGPKPKHSRDY